MLTYLPMTFLVNFLDLIGILNILSHTGGLKLMANKLKNVLSKDAFKEVIKLLSEVEHIQQKIFKLVDKETIATNVEKLQKLNEK